MKITFREIRDGMANNIFVNGRFVGIVEVYSWPKIWKMKPVFQYNYRKSADIAYARYDSCYKAAKAMAKLYEDTFNNVDDEDITDEIDMRGIFKSIGAGP